MSKTFVCSDVFHVVFEKTFVEKNIVLSCLNCLNLEKTDWVFLLPHIAGIYFDPLHLQQLCDIIYQAHILIIRVASICCQSSYFLRISAFFLILIV